MDKNLNKSDVHHRQLAKVTSIHPVKRKAMDVREYRQQQIDKKFDELFAESGDLLDQMAQEALDNLDAGLADDLDPDRM